MMTPAVVGVDNGGTWIRLIGLDRKGRRLWSLKSHSPTVSKLPAFLRAHLKRFHGQLDGLAVGSRGVWKQAARHSVQRRLHGLAKNIVVISDVEAAWKAAFKSHGIVVIAGTGSIAYGRTSSGRIARAGGQGPEKGDEGSGYWIGKQWLARRRRGGERGSRRAREFKITAGLVRQIAKTAPHVIRLAQCRNPAARIIIEEAQHHLAKLVCEIIEILRWKGSVPVSMNGSLLMNNWFRGGFFSELRREGVRFKYVKRRVDAAFALATMVLSRAPAP